MTSAHTGADKTLSDTSHKVLTHQMTYFQEDIVLKGHLYDRITSSLESCIFGFIVSLKFRVLLQRNSELI